MGEAQDILQTLNQLFSPHDKKSISHIRLCAFSGSSTAEQDLWINVCFQAGHFHLTDGKKRVQREST